MSIDKHAIAICFAFFVYSFFASQTHAQKNQELVRLPEQITGTVADDQGNPIAGAEIKLTLYSPENGSLPTFKGDRFPLPIAITNEQGKYELDTTGLQANGLHFSLWGYITAKGFPAYRMAKTVKNYDGKAIEMHDSIMPAGRKITGRVVAPEGGVRPNAIALRLIGESGNSKYFFRWNSPTLGCGPDGSFETYVPKVGKVELSVTAGNFAGVQLDVPPASVDFGDVVLQKGTSVFGKVLDENNEPVVGTVVTISGTQSNIVAELAKNSLFSPISSSVKTNDRGEYRLPPHTGSCRIAIANQGQLRSDDEFLASDVPLPVITPRLIDLTKLKAEHQVILQTGASSLISGKFLWPDGKPAADVQIKASVMSGGSGVDVDQTTTDERGEYKLRIPVGMKYAAASLSCFGAKVSDGNYAYALPKTTNAKTQELFLHPKRASVQFTNVDNDILNVDWELKLQEKTAATYTVSRKGRESRMALGEISTRFNRAGNVGVEPFKIELLELEEKYRGEFAAIIALRQALDWEQDFNSDYPPNPAKRAKLKIIADHYHSHEDIDVVLATLAGQIYDPTAVGVLEKLVTESPHDRVKATAAFQLCEHLNEQLQLVESLKQTSWSVTVPGRGSILLESLDDTEQYTDQDRANFQPIYNALKNLDVNELRGKVIKYATLIETDFPDVERSRIIASVGSFDFRRYESKENETYADILKPIRFELENLQVGQTIPDLKGNDVIGKPFQLSSLRGKSVVLFFGRATESSMPYEKLKAQFEGLPFEIVSVFSDPNVEVVKNAIQDGQITWPVIWDGENNAIAKSWNMSGGTADLFLLDTNGVIVKRILDLNSGGDVKKLERQIKLLIRQAEK